MNETMIAILLLSIVIIIMFIKLWYRKSRNSQESIFVEDGWDPTFDITALPNDTEYDIKPIKRKDIEEGSIHSKWTCQICDFSNVTKKDICTLCGTEKDFPIHIRLDTNDETISFPPKSTDPMLIRKSSFSQLLNQSSFPKLNLKGLHLNTRQKAAIRRKEWVRDIGKDGKRYWKRKTSHLNTNDIDILTKENQVYISASSPPRESIGFVSRINLLSNKFSTTTVNNNMIRHERENIISNGRLTFTEISNELDASISVLGDTLNKIDINVLEDIASFDFQSKYLWFLEQTSNMMHPVSEGYLLFDIHRDSIIQESLGYLINSDMKDLRSPLRIRFLGESGIDAGALQREWFTILSEKLFDDNLGLFLYCNQETKTYMINPSSESIIGKDHLLCFRATGRLLGRAILENQTLKCTRLCLPLLKNILGVPLSFSDLQFMEPEIYKSMIYLRDTNGIDHLELDFSILETDSENPCDFKIIDLIPGGRDILVTDENKQEYLRLRLRYMLLDRFNHQLQCFLEGIYEVIPQEYLMVFDYQELNLVLCGNEEIDVEDWYLNTQVSKDLVDTNTLKWFWEIIREMNQSDQAKLLQWSTGSSCVPVQGFQALTSYDGRICLFTLKKIQYNNDMPYPRAHACFNRIDLPEYPNIEEMRNMLYLVLNMEIVGFSDD